MSDQEFETLDELYFIQAFEDLLSLTGLPEDGLRKVLQQMLEKGWVRIYQPADTEIPYDNIRFGENYRNYYYIASKAGLMAHNGKEG